MLGSRPEAFDQWTEMHENVDERGQHERENNHCDDNDDFLAESRVGARLLHRSPIKFADCHVGFTPESDIR